ncbi:TetR/AcrR family transcriptional regulator [Jiella pacifica]|uniref:TetR/AcrR family transcriptional regulator n=1 Tax=Jiella pacifica TaxID=2696469 RepID=UPI00194036F5|nr:TetR/AcrR family transcriptional regulator [Jiella pacifica]
MLENAILDAAWAELAERGYPGFTLEGVAKRACTSRPVLHRRWPSRSKLATAAMARFVALNPIKIPDLGSVRDEMKVLLRLLSDRARPDLVRLLFDLQADLAGSASSFAEAKGGIVEQRHVAAILERGIARGEIDAARVTSRIADLPTDLARHEILMTFAPLPKEAIDEIVDEIFLPLVRAPVPDPR